MVERRIELDRRYTRKKKMKKLKAKLETATGDGPRQDSVQDQAAQPVLDRTAEGGEVERREPSRAHAVSAGRADRLGSASLSRPAASPNPARTPGTSSRRSPGCGSPRPAPSARPAPGSSPCGGRCRCRPRSPCSGRGVMVRPSAHSSTSAPSLRSSVARAAMRSVSLWRMWATLRIVVGPSAKQATAAERHHGVADVVHVDVDAAERAAVDGDDPSHVARRGSPSRSSTSTKPHVALQALASSGRGR